MARSSRYVGRFAPSPTGPLHLGSLVAALASFLDARANDGLWLLRVEDLDPPRESKQAAAQILSTLEILGLHWDGPTLWQSDRLESYECALIELQAKNLIFECVCNRAKASGVYKGYCRNKVHSGTAATSRRLKVADQTIRFDDLFQGEYAQNLAKEVGDFVVKRKDGLFAYQLAVVVDDAFQAVTHVIRGHDLLSSTTRQIFLQQVLGFDTPHYGHHPVVVNDDGNKLSKQTHAAPVDVGAPQLALLQALTLLRQSPPRQLAASGVFDIISWATSHWDPTRLVGESSIRI